MFQVTGLSSVSSAKYPYLFVITYGRSGSTLLQGILNSIPGYCIRGENNGILNYYRHIHQGLSTAKQKFSNIGRTPADPWYGIDEFVPDTHLDAVRAMIVDHVLRPPPGTRCLGFKEIRYARPMVGDLGTLLAFARQLFPGAGFVFNSRNLDDVFKSGWWKNHKDPQGFLEDFERGMTAAFEQHADCSCWVRYDDYIVDPSALRELFEFLDEPFNLPAVEKVLAVPHSG